MKSVLRYKGYTGSVEFDAESNVLHGRVMGIRDLVGYHGTSVDELRADFQAGVDDYLESCAEDGVEPQKPLSGKFSLRMDPSLHRDLTDRAAATGQSINQVAIEAIEAHLGRSFDT